MLRLFLCNSLASLFVLKEEEIIEGCKTGKPACQEALYRLYGPRMKGICLRYAKTDFEAEDTFQEAFFSVVMYSTTSTSSCSVIVFCRSAGMSETGLLVSSSRSRICRF